MNKNTYLGLALAFMALISAPLLAEDTPASEPQVDSATSPAPNTEQNNTATSHQQPAETQKAVRVKNHKSGAAKHKSSRHCNQHKPHKGKAKNYKACRKAKK